MSEKNLVLNQEVEKVIDYLQKNKFVYKGKIKGFEFWTGEKWNTNKEEFVRLCQRDSLVKTLQDLHDVSSSS